MALILSLWGQLEGNFVATMQDRFRGEYSLSTLGSRRGAALSTLGYRGKMDPSVPGRIFPFIFAFEDRESLVVVGIHPSRKKAWYGAIRCLLGCESVLGAIGVLHRRCPLKTYP